MTKDSNNPESTSKKAPPLTPIEQAILADVVSQAESDSGASQPPPTTEQIHTTTGPQTIYTWQMLDSERGWNIIGMRMPNGATLPMVTTSIESAWSLFEVAQQHANAHGVQCRLAGWGRPDVLAIVDPEVER
jgi:hypothetical protein